MSREGLKLFAHFPGHFCRERVMGQGGGGCVARGTKVISTLLLGGGRGSLLSEFNGYF